MITAVCISGTRELRKNKGIQGGVPRNSYRDSSILFTRTTSQSPRMRETLATVAITRGNSRSVFSFVGLLRNITIHTLTELQRIFPLSYCNSGVIPLKYAYLPFSSILGILIVRSFPAAVISSKSNSSRHRLVPRDRAGCGFKICFLRIPCRDQLCQKHRTDGRSEKRSGGLGRRVPRGTGGRRKSG